VSESRGAEPTYQDAQDAYRAASNGDELPTADEVRARGEARIRDEAEARLGSVRDRYGLTDADIQATLTDVGAIVACATTGNPLLCGLAIPAALDLGARNYARGETLWGDLVGAFDTSDRRQGEPWQLLPTPGDSMSVSPGFPRADEALALGEWMGYASSAGVTNTTREGWPRHVVALLADPRDVARQWRAKLHDVVVGRGYAVLSSTVDLDRGRASAVLQAPGERDQYAPEHVYRASARPADLGAVVPITRLTVIHEAVPEGARLLGIPDRPYGYGNAETIRRVLEGQADDGDETSIVPWIVGGLLAWKFGLFG